jgi:hypothetical protein
VRRLHTGAWASLRDGLCSACARLLILRDLFLLPDGQSKSGMTRIGHFFTLA